MISFVDHIEGSEDLLVYVIKDTNSLPENFFINKEIELEKVNEKGVYLTGDSTHKRWVVDISKLEEASGNRGDEIRSSAAKIAHKIEDEASLRIVFDCEGMDQKAFLESFVLSQYEFNYLKSEAKDKERFLRVEGAENGLVDEVQQMKKYVFWARDLVNFPLSHLNAEQLCEKIAKEAKLLGCTVQQYEKKQLESLKMGGLLAVNRGSEDPPAMVVAEWKPDNAVNEKPVVLVGKGIVYDTGGLSLKPTANSMDIMKSDMAGSAGVSGAFLLLAAMQLPVYVKLIVPATDNRPGKNAYAPGDVITHFDGTTVEVMNTDAEGRLILADGISFAQKKHQPQIIFTMATLTGASLRATGHNAASVMGNDRDSIDGLTKAGRRCGEKLIEAPFWDEYKEELKSDIADMKNIGGPYAGHVTAGKFLEHFAQSPYVHLDIASTGFLPKQKDFMPKGGTGFGVRLMYEFIVENWTSNKS